MKSSIYISLLIASMLISNSILAAPFTNGSFEQPDSIGIGSFKTYTAANTTISGWTVESGSIDWIGSFWTASDGSRSIDLSGNTAGSISQSFDTIIGNQYNVTFDLAGNPDDKNIKDLTVTAPGYSESYLFDNSSYSRTNMGWTTCSFFFIATSESSKLTFTSNNSTGYGPAIDNVNVSGSAVPLPSAFLLLGSGLLGLISFRGIHKS